MEQNNQSSASTMIPIPTTGAPPVLTYPATSPEVAPFVPYATPYPATSPEVAPFVPYATPYPPQQDFQPTQPNQQLQQFWADQYQKIKETTDFKNHNLPLARIKKIMKADEDVHMIAAEAPAFFARACEMFILELTHRSWAHTEENKRRILQKSDIAATIAGTDVFDFLLDVAPSDGKVEGLITGAHMASASVPTPDQFGMYYYLPQ